MTAYIIVIIGVVLLALYVARIACYALTISLSSRKKQEVIVLDEIALTLLVPVRNEAKNLPDLIIDIRSQSYSSDKFEVIFINDHSDDRSLEIIESLTKEAGNTKLLHLPEHLQGKKEAISLGIQEARNGRIIQTDADCRLSQDFIREHAEAAAGNQVFIAGPVRHAQSKKLLDNLEALEFMSLIGSSMGSFLTKKPVMCNGANLSYDKAFYLRNEQELKKIPSPSGDDIFLLIRAKKEGMEMVYLLSENAAVMTGHAGSFKAFIQQRIRWGSKARFYADSDMIYLALLTLLMNIYIIATLVAALIDPIYWLLFGTTLFIKSLADLLLLSATAKHLNRRKLLWYFPLAAIFYYFYLVLTGLLSLFTGYHWKGRNIKTTDH